LVDKNSISIVNWFFLGRNEITWRYRDIRNE
jgi:hypothetical protein